MRLQNWLTSLENGTGRRLLIGFATVLGIVILSLYLAHKRQHGPESERVIDQALVGRSLARGEGFTTPVRYPQSVAVLSARDDWTFDFRSNLPGLHNEPLYPLLLSAFPYAAGEGLQDWLFADPAITPSGASRYRGDDYLLLVNVALLWGTLPLAWLVARRLFSPLVAWISLAGVCLSAGVWKGALLLSGAFLPAALLLSLLYVLLKIDAAISLGQRKGWMWVGVAGALTGLTFLADYFAVIPALVLGTTFLVMKLPRKAVVPAVCLFLVATFVVCMPWLLRNLSLVGHPLGLAWQSVALSAADPTADPAHILNQLSNDSPRALFRKVMGKGLSGIEGLFSGDLWAGGSFLFLGLFLPSPLYRFRRIDSRVLHWSVLAAVAITVLLHPFLSSGASTRPPQHWLAPLIIMFGAAFLVVLVEILAERPRWQQQGIIMATLFLHSLPLLYMLGEPRRAPFTYPPYIPALFVLTRTELMEKRPDYYGIMADVPAGLAWYSNQRVWSQPASFPNFEAINRLQPIEAHLLTPVSLDRPFFGELIRREGRGDSASWAELYASLPAGSLPPSYPLLRVSPLFHNVFLLHN